LCGFFVCQTRQTPENPKTPCFWKKNSPTKTLTVNLWDGKHFYLAYKNFQNRGFLQKST
jgi:hypothetical protein